MKVVQALFLVLLGSSLLIACEAKSDSTPEPRFDITLEPTQIAANLRKTPVITPTEIKPTPAALSLSPLQATQAPTAAETLGAQATTPTAAALTTTTQPSPLVATPTSNAEELRGMVDNPNLVASIILETTCFLANDYIPFSLQVTSLETQPIYFYKNGKWMLSINNSPVGPQLSSLPPSLRDDFAEIDPNDTYTHDEEDIGLWVLSLGPESGIPFTPTGIGLPAGDYWVTFIYNNDQDGLTEQVDGTFLIDKAAWRGTAVASEVRFKVVDDLTECEGE